MVYRERIQKKKERDTKKTIQDFKKTWTSILSSLQNKRLEGKDFYPIYFKLQRRKAYINYILPNSNKKMQIIIEMDEDE